MTKDPKSAEGKGTPAKKSGPASKVQSREQEKEQAKVKTKLLSKVLAKVLEKVPLQEQPPTAVPGTDGVAAPAAVVVPPPPLVVAFTRAAAPVWAEVSSPHETTAAAGQEGTLIIRMERTFTVLGVGAGHTVFKDAEGAVFHIDPVTGEKRTLTADYFLRPADSKGERSAGKIKFTNVMIVSILGADAHGNTVMRNARNETFTLDPRTGAKVLIKWPK